MKNLTTITRGTRSAKLYKNRDYYIVIATYNNGEIVAPTFSGKSWKTEKGAINAIQSWIFDS